ncbi:unnamed protein product [Spirodela intermedia]|uniref:ELYS-like domain-containing protein n=1 Tax=Spirodela intermedia TaxID=51605 RepID=A0A7I8LI24_SPIIN|nr:unnamed protein product [Spirodela intermedia]
MFVCYFHAIHHGLFGTLTIDVLRHLDVMIWCIRHKFLENVESRYPNSVSWNLHVSERKLAAIERTWPNLTGYTAETAMQNESTLFIEDALSNLQIEQDIGRTVSGELDVRSLLGDAYQLSDLSEMVGVSGLYPFKDLRSAADILFLHGTSDVFLYYLFDRHWSTPDVNWRHIVDDFATSFNIHRRSVLESLVFYLLDDHSDEALHQASQLLPVIAGRDTHPKVAEVLLERQRPDLALMVLRCCGRDGFSAHSINHDGSLIVSLNVAVTAVRVRIECGLLTEAFIYQRMHCSQVKENKLRCGSSEVFSDGVEDGLGSWVRHLEVLVTEICSLCVRRNLVDRMIELPWNSDEELVLHKCLFDKACQQPSSINGSLLVVFYLQRCRYVEAYQIDDKLRSLEQNFFQTASEEEVSKIRSISQWREGLINKSIELLPEVQRVQLKSGNSIAIKSLTAKDVGFTHEEPPNSSNSLVDSSLRASFVLHADNTSIMSKTSGYVHKEVSSAGSFGTNAPRGQNKQNLVSRGSSVVPGPDASGKYSSYPPNGGPPGPNGFSPAEAVHKDGESQQYPFGDLSIQRSIGSPVTPFEWKLSRSSALDTRFQDENATGLAEKATFSFLRRASVQEHPSQVDAIHKSVVSYNSYADNISASSVKGYQPGQFAPSVSLEQEKKTNAFWRSDERETPKAMNTNGVPRWRSDDSSEDEDKSESFMGSRMSSLKRRSKHGRI